MSVQIVQFRTDPADAVAVEAAIGRLFDAVRAVGPVGLEYSAARIGEGSEFLLSLVLSDDADNPLLQIPEAGAFRSHIGRWTGEPVPPVTLHILERYSA